MKPKTLSLIASITLLSLIALCLAWETMLAPLRPGGSWMTLKVLPLMAALFGILRGTRYTFLCNETAILVFFTLALLGALAILWGNALALAEAVLSVVFFVVVVLYSRNTAPSRLAQASKET